MEITVKFDPLVDPLAKVIGAVNACYGSTNKLLDQTVQITFETPMFNANEIQASNMAQAAAGLTPAPLASAGAAQPAPTATAAPGTTPNANASSAPTSTGSGGAVLDAVGVPWDARIHSGAIDEATGLHKKTAKGVWTKRKGVDDMTYTTVTNELLNLMAAKPQVAPNLQPAAAPLGNPVHVPHQVAVPVEGADDEYEIAQPQPLPVPAALAPSVMPAPVLAAPIVPHDFVTLMQYVSVNLQTEANPAGKLTQADIQRICAHFGLVDGQGNAAVAMLQHRPDYVPVVYQSFAAQIAAVAG
jgi:hypothetical protein